MMYPCPCPTSVTGVRVGSDDCVDVDDAGDSLCLVDSEDDCCWMVVEGWSMECGWPLVSS